MKSAIAEHNNADAVIGGAVSTAFLKVRTMHPPIHEKHHRRRAGSGRSADKDVTGFGGLHLARGANQQRGSEFLLSRATCWLTTALVMPMYTLGRGERTCFHDRHEEINQTYKGLPKPPGRSSFLLYVLEHTLRISRMYLIVNQSSLA